MKKLFLFIMLLAVPFLSIGQIVNYSAGMLVDVTNDSTLRTSDTSFTFQVDGKNFQYWFGCSWDTSHVHTSALKVQQSREGSRWYNIGTDSITTTRGTLQLYGTDIQANYLRFWLDVGTNDTLRWLKMEYVIKKR